MDVADPRAGRDAGGRGGFGIAVQLTQQFRQVKAQRVHLDRAAFVVRPLRPGPVTVDLDPLPSGSRRYSASLTRWSEAPLSASAHRRPAQRARQLDPARDQDREVKQPAAARIERGRMAVLVQDDERRAAAGVGQRQRAIVPHAATAPDRAPARRTLVRARGLRPSARPRRARSPRRSTRGRGFRPRRRPSRRRQWTEQVPSRGTPGSRLSNSANVLSSSSEKRSTNSRRTPATCERDARRRSRSRRRSAARRRRAHRDAGERSIRPLPTRPSTRRVIPERGGSVRSASADIGRWRPSACERSAAPRSHASSARARQRVRHRGRAGSPRGW